MSAERNRSNGASLASCAKKLPDEPYFTEITAAGWIRSKAMRISSSANCRSDAAAIRSWPLPLGAAAGGIDGIVSGFAVGAPWGFASATAGFAFGVSGSLPHPASRLAAHRKHTTVVHGIREQKFRGDEVTDGAPMGAVTFT